MSVNIDTISYVREEVGHVLRDAGTDEELVREMPASKVITKVAEESGQSFLKSDNSWFETIFNSGF